FRRKVIATRRCHAQRTRAVHDMAVRENQPVRREGESGGTASTASTRVLLSANAHDGRRRRLGDSGDRARVSVEYLAIVAERASILWRALIRPLRGRAMRRFVQ